MAGAAFASVDLRTDHISPVTKFSFSFSPEDPLCGMRKSNVANEIHVVVENLDASNEVKIQ